MDEASWNKILAEVKPLSVSIEGLLRSSKPLFYDGKKLQLGVYYKFHKDKLEELKTKKMLEDVAQKVFQTQVVIECSLSELPKKVELTDVQNQNIIATAEQMFS